MMSLSNSKTNLGFILGPYRSDTKRPIFMLPWKCAGVGAAENSKNTDVRCGSVRVKKLLCAECAGVPKLTAHKYSVDIQ